MISPQETKPSLHYIVRHPKIKTEKPPLLLLLHGVGGNEQNMFSLANSLPENFLIVAVRGPLTLAPGSYAWFNVQFSEKGPVINEAEAEVSRKAILAFLAELKQQEKYDPKRVYLMGFSQGGIMSYSAALTEPEKITGIAVMSGRLLPEVKPLIANNERLAQLKVFVSHGKQDNVLQVQYAYDAVGYLKTKGIVPEFHEYTDGHTITGVMLADVNKWLSESLTVN